MSISPDTSPVVQAVDAAACPRPKPPKPRKQKPKQKSKNAKRPLLLDQISDGLIDQYDSHRKLSPCQCCGYLINRLRSVNSSSSASLGSGSRSSCTLVNSDSSDASSRKNSGLASDPSSSESSLDVKRPDLGTPIKQKYRTNANVFTLDDVPTIEIIRRLAEQYGRISHMGILDRSYSIFLNNARTAALSFKVQNKVAIVQGDPLGDPSSFKDLLAEFARYRKRFRWSIAFMGASGPFVDFAKGRHWTTLQFCKERVLNPMNNDVLFERSGKRIIVQNRQLLDPAKGGITMGIYAPSHDDDFGLQRDLIQIYDAWRLERNRSTTPQAFITVYDPFAIPDLMTYIYTRGPDGVPNGFAALRKIGAKEGYHIDPCIAAPGAPRGISDLLVFAAMAVLNRAGVPYLSFGFEPLDALGEITGMRGPVRKATRALYQHFFQRLPFGGKKGYHDKFRPDEFQESKLYLIFPARVPSARHAAAMTHMANVSIRKLIFGEGKTPDKNWTTKQERDTEKADRGAPREFPADALPKTINPSKVAYAIESTPNDERLTGVCSAGA